MRMQNNASLLPPDSCLRIWVCFKVQPDFDHVLESDWASFGPESDISYAKHELNCFDESSLEIALRLKESLAQNGVAARLGAVTLAESLRVPTQRQLFAAGYDELLRVDGRAEFSPAETGRSLAAQLAARKPDLLLLGRQAGYADTGTVPYYLAEALGLPLLSGVENIRWDKHGLTVTQAENGTRRELLVSTPLAMVIGNSPVSALRASTLRQQLEAGKRRAEVVEDGARASITAPMLVRNRQTRRVKMLDGAEAAGAILRIIQGSGCAAHPAAQRESNLAPWLRENAAAFGILLADSARTDAAIRYAVKNGLPCVNGVCGVSGDGKSVIKKVCGSHLEWHIPILKENMPSSGRGREATGYINASARSSTGDAGQVWVISPAVTEELDGFYPGFDAETEKNPAIIEVLREEAIPAGGLSSARLLFVGGRGMGGKEGVEKLGELAALLSKKLKLTQDAGPEREAASPVGARAVTDDSPGITRAAAQNGWGGMDRVIGQSGAVTAPDCCIVFGASGAAAFMAGVEKARTLIAVNTDPDAPIFSYADYGVIADARSIVDEMRERILRRDDV